MTKCQCKESTHKHHRPGECKNPATHKDTQMCDPCHNEKVAKQMVDTQAGTNTPCLAAARSDLPRSAQEVLATLTRSHTSFSGLGLSFSNVSGTIANPK